ncbi:MAG: hypothetical protein ABFC31_02535 [Clostridiaceae bacterium]
MKQQKFAPNSIERKLSGAAAPQPARNAGDDEEFDALVSEITRLISEDKLPEGFDLKSAASDPALIELMREYGAAAGVRIYAAEQRAEEAENSAMQRVSAEVRQRNALPRSIRGGNAAASGTNYRGMDAEAFRSLMAQMKKTARDGGKTRL